MTNKRKEDLGIAVEHFKSVTHPQKEGSWPATVGLMKLQRMEIKNQRRAKQGLPPILDYRKL